jgi:ParB family transcriptional regulator, chromosome partitioning protein
MLEITYQKVTDLIPYVNNSRTHSEEQVKQIAASIKEFGFTNPILIDENKGVIAGHGRLLAAGKLALAEVPTIVLEGLTEAQRKAYVIADNRLALNAGWE